MIFAVILLALVLVSLMRRIVTLLFQRSTPQQIDRVTPLLQVMVLVGELAFVIRFIAPGWAVVLLTSFVSSLAMIALLPGNPISDSVAFLRIRGLRYYRPGDWITVADHQYGCVVAIRPLYTLLLTPTQGQLRLRNSLVVGVPIVVHRDQTPPTVDDSLLVTPSTGVINVDKAEVLSIGSAVRMLEPPLGRTAPLVKRPVLGKISVKLLLPQ